MNDWIPYYGRRVDPASLRGWSGFMARLTHRIASWFLRRTTYYTMLALAHRYEMPQPVVLELKRAFHEETREAALRVLAVPGVNVSATAVRYKDSNRPTAPEPMRSLFASKGNYYAKGRDTRLVQEVNAERVQVRKEG